jgi:hypothetical protein
MYVESARATCRLLHAKGLGFAVDFLPDAVRGAAEQQCDDLTRLLSAVLPKTRGRRNTLSDACCGKLIVTLGMQWARAVAHCLQHKRAWRRSVVPRWSPSTCVAINDVLVDC